MRRIRAAVLGATGAVGQQFIQLLAAHPWFEICAVAASERNTGRRYGDACRWLLPSSLPTEIAALELLPARPGIDAEVVFSALPGEEALEIEAQFARAGYVVCSNASAHRLEPDVPLIIPEVNADHLGLIAGQRAGRGWSGLLVTSPNCTTTTAVMAAKPLHDAFGLRRLCMMSMQAVSGAGYPGVASLDILDNVVPFVPGEEAKMERETCVLLGNMVDGARQEAEIVISAQANRVPVVHGHTVCLAMEFAHKPEPDEATQVLRDYRAPDIVRTLPSAPACPILVREERDRPQPRLDRDSEHGMAATVGRIRACPVMHLRLVSVIHNTIRGAAGGAILNAELLLASGYLSR